MGTKVWTAEELGDRIFESCLAAFDVYTIHLGRKLGYYEALALAPLTSQELADRTSTAERYAREWLEQQAVAGLLRVGDASFGAKERRYELSAGYASVLNDRDGDLYMGPAASMTAAAGAALPAVADAFRSGSGVPWEAYGEDMILGQGEMNRPLFLNVLGPEWLRSIPDVHALLSREGARAVDVGSGHGWASIGIARTYPSAVITGLDIDESSIAAARKNAAEFGVDDRVTFQHGDAAGTGLDGEIDVVIALECLHDMPDPVSVLASMRVMAGSDGIVLVVDERTSDEFDPNAGDAERFLYGFSVTTCLPDSMSQQPSVATGTVIRRSHVEQYAADAGFVRVEVVPIDHEQFRVYRLVA